MSGTVFNFAGIAQLVERNLAKVEVASSNLVSRSRYKNAPQRGAFLYLERAGWVPLFR